MQALSLLDFSSIGLYCIRVNNFGEFLTAHLSSGIFAAQDVCGKILLNRASVNQNLTGQLHPIRTTY